MSHSASAVAALRRPLLLGHRGCRGAFAENTIEAFDHAIASGCDGFEFDVRLTRDAKAIIFHDARLHRRAIAQATYEELLNQKVRVNPSLIRRRRQGEVCCLDDVLARHADRAFFYIELKVAGVEEITIEAIRKNRPKQFVVASFLPRVVTRLHELSPELPIGFIFDNLAGLRRWRDLPVSHVMPNYRLVTERRIAAMHAAGKQVLTWTVNGARKMRQLSQWGIDGIVSDDPVLLSNTFSGHAGLAL